MREILPGLYHWSAIHPRIGARVSSWWLESADEGNVAIDPLAPEQTLEWISARARPPRAVLLSNRHHLRDSARLAGAYGCPILCNALGLHEFAAEQGVIGFAAGAEGTALPGGVIAYEFGVICPDETALHLPDQHALLLADAVVRAGDSEAEGAIGFVPDALMDDPAETKRGILAVCERLLDELSFEHLLLAHGGPVLDEGRALLEDLVACGGRTAFEL